jgi:prepilin-type N-terminal cleavage/methylation domain-containing protein
MFSFSKKLIGDKRGFSILELMVVLAIFAIMTTILISDIPNFKQKSGLDLTASEIVTYLRGAQTYSSSQKGADIVPTESSLAYGIHINLTTNNVTYNDFYLFKTNKTGEHEEGYDINGFKILKIEDSSGSTYSGVDILYQSNSLTASLGTTLEPKFYRDFPSSEIAGINYIDIIVAPNNTNFCGKRIRVYNNGQISLASC